MEHCQHCIYCMFWQRTLPSLLELSAAFTRISSKILYKAGTYSSRKDSALQASRFSAL